MLLPLSRIWSSFATTLLPSAVISLRTETRGRDGQNRNSLRAGRLGWERKEKNALDRSRSDARRRVEAAFGLTRVATHYSTTSSSTMLTYTSNPLSVPTISLSDFIMIQMRDPTHRSTSSEGSSWLGFVAIAFVGRAAMFASLHVNVCVRVALSANAASGWTNGACECEDGAQGFSGAANWRSFASARNFDFFFSPTLVRRFATVGCATIDRVTLRGVLASSSMCCCRIESGSSGLSLVSPRLSHAAPAPAPAAAPTLHASNPASSSDLFSCFPMNTSRDVRASPSSHGRSGMPSKSACTPWNT